MSLVSVFIVVVSFQDYYDVQYLTRKQEVEQRPTNQTMEKYVKFRFIMKKLRSYSPLSALCYVCCKKYMYKNVKNSNFVKQSFLCSGTVRHRPTRNLNQIGSHPQCVFAAYGVTSVPW